MTQSQRTPRLIVEKYCRQLASEVGRVADILETTVSGQQDTPDAVKRLHGEFHRMSGAASCMGFPRFGQELAAVEHLLESLVEHNLTMSREVLEQVGLRLEAIARFAVYISPENSMLLQEAEARPVPAVTGRKSTDEQLGEVARKQRILFADDDVSIRMLMREILISLGVPQVQVVASGAELLETAPLFDPTIIITDWLMKPVDGLEFLRSVRQGKAGIAKDTAVIFLTSQKSVEKVQTVIGEGVDHFLVKPFTHNLVARSVYQVATRRKVDDVAYL